MKKRRRTERLPQESTAPLSIPFFSERTGLVFAVYFAVVFLFP
jgi:hypothetical protein